MSYIQDTISIEAGPGQDDPPADLAGRYDRVDLLANLIDHRTDPSIPLVVDLPATGSFTAVLDAIRRAPDPIPIPADCVTWVGTGDDPHPVVADVGRWIRLAVDRGRTFTELGAPWTARAAAGRDRPLQLGEKDIGGQRTGLDVVDRHSPRPYLHPLRTLDGLVLTDAAPADHPWHLGLGIAVPDVNGSNIWGGPTYRWDTGYRWRVDHGRIDLIDSRDGATSLDQRLHWVDVTGSTVLAERRHLAWWLPAAPGVWVLDLSTTLESSGDDVQLGSPATHGRAGAGYGGLFWRLPAVDDLDVRTASAAGEQDVHGRVDPWLAVGLRVGERRASVLIVADPDAHDPWFVRVSDYAGVGAAWAWDRTVVVDPARPLHRHYRFVVADGIRDPHELAAIAAVREPTAD